MIDLVERARRFRVIKFFKNMPQTPARFKRTAGFDDSTLPAGLPQHYRTKPGVASSECSMATA